MKPMAAALSGEQRSGSVGSSIVCVCHGRPPDGPKRQSSFCRHHRNGAGTQSDCAPVLPSRRTCARLPGSCRESAWSEVTWREGSKGAQRSRFAQLALWAANGWRQGPQPERVKEIALVEWPADEEE